MRLISQTGDVDIPYETTSLSRTGNIIRAYVQMISVEMCIRDRCKVSSSEKLGTYRAICVGIKTSGGSRKYYDVCEVLRDMEENFVSVKAVLNNLLLDAPCPYCEKEKEN